MLSNDQIYNFTGIKAVESTHPHRIFATNGYRTHNTRYLKTATAIGDRRLLCHMYIPARAWSGTCDLSYNNDISTQTKTLTQYSCALIIFR